MKKSKILVFSTILAALLLSASCTQNTESGDNPSNGSASTPGTTEQKPENGGNKPKDPTPTPSPTEETVEFKLDDLVSAFSLTKGDITASDAAKKIKTETPTVTGITFTEKKIISYDDKSGTFTVEVKGNKGGKSFSNKITAQGFTHPYNSNPSSKIYGDKIKLDAAMEDNQNLDAFINELKNAANLENYLNLSYSLENGKTIDFNDSEKPYKLTANFTKNGDKIKVSPKYALIYRSLTEGGTEDVKEENMEVISPAFRDIEYEYFTEKDVFEYVQEKIKDDILKVPTDTFASSIYAFAKYQNITPNNIFNVGDGSKFKKYQDTYKKDGGHIKIVNGSGDSDLSYAIFDPKNSGIEADDYSGSIKVNYYVQKTANIAAVNTGAHDAPLVQPVQVEKSGFMKVTKEFLRKNFMFSLVKYGNKTEARKKWLQKQFNNIEILGEGTGEAFKPKNLSLIAYDISKRDYYCLNVNSDTNLAGYLAVQTKGYTSIANALGTEYTLLITSIRMEKKINEKELYLTFYFKGSNNPIKLTLAPNPAVWD
ncbi:MAG: lipoprotein 17-related variable surface protein [Treponema sp.]